MQQMRYEARLMMNKIGLLIADKDEYTPFVSSLSDIGYKKIDYLDKEGVIFNIGCAEVTAILCGIGKVNAAAGAMHLIDKGCKIVLNFGMSGGLAGIKRGACTFPELFLEHDFDLSEIGYMPYLKPGQSAPCFADKALLKIAKKIGFETSMLAVSGDRFICDDNLKNKLIKELGADSCDMETAAAAAVCNAANIPFSSLRRISDDGGSDALKTHRKMNSFDNMSLPNAFLTYLKEVIKNYEF